MPKPKIIRRLGGSVVYLSAALALLSSGPAQASETPSGACVQQQVNPKSGLLEISNRCELPVSVYYRDLKQAPKASASKPGVPAQPRNAYFTHMKTVAAGRTEAIYLAPAERLRVALCVGQKRPYDSSGFRSDEAGNHVCPDADLPEDYLLVQATGASRDEACAAVRNAFLPGKSAALDCQCIVQASSGKAYCRMSGPAHDAKDEKDREGAGVSVISRVKKLLRDKNNEHWEERYRNCGTNCPDPAQAVPRNGGPGVRG